MLFSIKNTDLTKHIVDESYEVSTEKTFNEWKDGNSRLHRIYDVERVVGTMQIICSEETGMTARDFIELIEENTTSDVLRCKVWVTNKAKFEIIEAFYEIKPVTHRDNIDIFELSLTEK